MESGFESKYVRLGRLRFHYLHWLNPHHLAILCLHGTGDTCHTWDTFGRGASEAFTVIALDQRGHGDSDWPIPPAYRCEDYVDDLRALIGALHLERFILMGHSMGALHCLRYAAESPEAVAALVHVDIEPYPPAWNKRYLKGLYENLPESYDSPTQVVRELRETCPFADDELLFRLAVSQLEERKDGKFYRKCDRTVFGSFDAYDLRESLPSIACPVLVIRGSQSRVMRHAAAEDMCRSLPRGRLVEIPSAAHPVHADNPDAFGSAVLGFLEGLGLATPIGAARHRAGTL
jgi:esterase